MNSGQIFKNHYLKTLESDLKQENIGGESALGIR